MVMSAESRSLQGMWDALAGIGRDGRTGGYRRDAWSPADLELRAWFEQEADRRGLDRHEDRNGNLWAWWGSPAAGEAVVTGSHLDSVPHGGGFDGALGVASALLAVDELRARGVQPRRPIGVVVFTEEEGSRFGVACLGSRLLTGAADPAVARALVDADGVTLAAAMAAAGLDPSALGPDLDRLARIGSFVELHIEQGRALTQPVGVASGVWPHGRWRLQVRGEGNHAGTTLIADRRDPMLTAAFAVLAANKEARLHAAHATVGRIAVHPNATNAVPETVTAWLDARAPEQSTLDSLVTAIERRVVERAARDGTTADLVAESVSPAVTFDPALRDRLVAALGGVPVLGTGAGHDAAVLATAGVPATMLFVRNPTGVSHSPAEHATAEDCTAGVTALARVLEELAC